jgi:hypothetical protein
MFIPHGFDNTLACPLKAGIIKPEETSVNRLRHSKHHARVEIVMHATIGELLWAVSSVGSAPRLYKENQFGV